MKNCHYLYKKLVEDKGATSDECCSCYDCLLSFARVEFQCCSFENSKWDLTCCLWNKSFSWIVEHRPSPLLKIWREGCCYEPHCSPTSHLIIGTCNSNQKLWMSSCPKSNMALHVPHCQWLFRALLRWNRSFRTPQMVLWLELIEILSCLSWCDTAALLQIHKRTLLM